MLSLLFFLVQRRIELKQTFRKFHFQALLLQRKSFQYKRRQTGPGIPSCPKTTPPEITPPSIASSGASPLPNCTSRTRPTSWPESVNGAADQIAYVKLVAA